MDEAWFVIDWHGGEPMIHGPFGDERQLAVDYATALIEENLLDREAVRLVKWNLERP